MKNYLLFLVLFSGIIIGIISCEEKKHGSAKKYSDSPDTIMIDTACVEEEIVTPKQYATYSFKQKTINGLQQGKLIVEDGKLTVKGNFMPKKEEIISCDLDVPASVIIDEYMGMYYWERAAETLFGMVEEDQTLMYDKYELTKELYQKSLVHFRKTREYCEGVYDRVHDYYKFMIEGENTMDSKDFWDLLSRISFEMGEYELQVCHIYFKTSQ